MESNMTIQTGIIIVSDKGSRGERVDQSGPAIRKVLEDRLFTVVDCQIVPDEKEAIQKAVLQCSESLKCDLILTSGGTGISPRDVTPEATEAIIDRHLPGFAEAMRMHSLTLTPHAMISRAVCGTYKETLILNLPGSPKGARECLEVVLPAIPHAIAKLKGDQSDCGGHHGLS
jgi:molybdopterin adenylyltransferase